MANFLHLLRTKEAPVKLCVRTAMAAKVSAALPSFMGDMPKASYLLLLICLR